MQKALDSDGFSLMAQPILGLNDGDDAIRYEILLRMNEVEGEDIPTESFLSAAERYQMMPQIDRWVVNATLAAISGGEIKLPANRSCAINLSGQTLGDESLVVHEHDLESRGLGRAGGLTGHHHQGEWDEQGSGYTVSHRASLGSETLSWRVRSGAHPSSTGPAGPRSPEATASRAAAPSRASTP